MTHSKQVRLTDGWIKTCPYAPTQSKQIFYRDQEQRGLGLRVTAKSKTFIFERRKDGKGTRIVIGEASNWTVKAAREKARELAVDMDKGIDIKAQKAQHKNNVTTLSKAYEQFGNDRTLRDATVATYDYCFNSYFPDWHDRKLTGITPKMVSDRYKRLKERHGVAQANIAMRFLRGLFYFSMAEHKGLLSENPVRILSEKKMWVKGTARKIRLPENKIGPWLNAALATRNIQHPETESVATYLILMLLHGFRESEGLSMKWATHVDFDARIVKYFDGDDYRELPMTDFVHQLLQKQKRRARKSPYVFPSPLSKSGHIQETKGTLATINRKAGVDVCALHDIRRTFSDVQNDLEIPDQTTKVLMGHKVRDVRGEHYLTFPLKTKLRALQKYEDFILGLAGFNPSEEHPLIDLL